MDITRGPLLVGEILLGGSQVGCDRVHLFIDGLKLGGQEVFVCYGFMNGRVLPGDYAFQFSNFFEIGLTLFLASFYLILKL